MSAEHLAVPDSPRLALLVLGGSSGRVEAERAEVLAAHGIAALAVPWFGADGLPPSPRRVPLEVFGPHLARLAGLAPRVGVVGTSFGAEAALLLGVLYPGLSLVAALAPTAVAWQTPDTDDAGHPVRDAKWTWGGEPVAGMENVDQHVAGPFDEARSWNDASLAACQDLSPYAIPVERIRATVLLSAGGDDRVWDSARACRDIAGRRAAAGRATHAVSHPLAGHRAVLPGEGPAPDRPGFPRGGTPEADAQHGEAILASLLQLAPGREERR